MKAYQIEEKHNGVGDIVFAETSGKAKIQAISTSYIHSDFTDIKVQRVPWADRFSKQGWIPKKEMLTHGWIFECERCFKYQNEETALVEGEKVYCERCYPHES